MDYGFDTLKIHGGYDSREHNRASVVPIYQTAAFSLEDTYHADRQFAFAEEGPVYSRLGNPTVAVLEERIRSLHGGSGAIAMASGMAAVSSAILNAVGVGGRLLTTPDLYGGTVDACASLLSEFNVSTDFAADSEPETFEKAIKEDTRAIFIESVTNPFATVPDMEKIAEVAHRHGIPLIVDNTTATPYLMNPFDFGADVIVYSATKGLTGHGNALAGLVVESGRFPFCGERFAQFDKPLWILKDESLRSRSVNEVFEGAPFTGRIRAIYLNYLGAVLSPFNAYLVMLGLETLSERLEKQLANTRKIVAYLEKSEHVEWVSHPYAKDSPYRELAARYFQPVPYSPSASGEVKRRGVNS